MQIQMSEPVQAAVDEAITVIHSLVTQILTIGSVNPLPRRLV